MKTKVTFRGNDFNVDPDENQSIYSQLESDVQSLELETLIDFYLTKRDMLFSPELIDFLDQAGVDRAKENEMYYYMTDDAFILEGWYDIVGDRTNKEKVTSFHWLIDSCTMNVYFETERRHGASPQFNNVGTFRLEFAIVIPSGILPTSNIK